MRVRGFRSFTLGTGTAPTCGVAIIVVTAALTQGSAVVRNPGFKDTPRHAH